MLFSRFAFVMAPHAYLPVNVFVSKRFMSPAGPLSLKHAVSDVRTDTGLCGLSLPVCHGLNERAGWFNAESLCSKLLINELMTVAGSEIIGRRSCSCCCLQTFNSRSFFPSPSSLLILSSAHSLRVSTNGMRAADGTFCLTLNPWFWNAFSLYQNVEYI